MDRMLGSVTNACSTAYNLAYETKANVQVRVGMLGEYQSIKNATSYVNQILPTKDSIEQRAIKSRTFVGQTGEQVICFAEQCMENASSWFNKENPINVKDKQISQLESELRNVSDDYCTATSQIKELLSENNDLEIKNNELEAKIASLTKKKRFF